MNLIQTYSYVELLILIIKITLIIYRHIFVKKQNLLERYGNNSWVLITGASSGQGKFFALEFAKMGFNILMIGSKKTFKIQKIINNMYKVKTEVIIKNFCHSFEPYFYDQIEFSIKNKDISVLINNVGYRVAWKPYYKMPVNYIKEIIAAKAGIQSRLTHMLLPQFIKREKKSCILITSAVCQIDGYGFAKLYSNSISVPYLTIYESTNAYSFYHANSLFEEFKINPEYKNIDYLNITPAAVSTPNTSKILKNAPFNIDYKIFVKNIINIIGNYNGTTCGSLQHEFQFLFLSIFPFFKQTILNNIGLKFSQKKPKKY